MKSFTAFFVASLRVSSTNEPLFIRYHYYEFLKFATENNINPIYINAIFSKPFFTVTEIEKITNQSYQATSFNIKKLLKSGKIYPDDKKRNKMYRFYDLIDILRK